MKIITIKKYISILPILILTSCASKDITQYHTLQPNNNSYKNAQNLKNKKIIVLSTVSTDNYLHRLALVTRDANNNIQISNYNYWAEPLDKNITSTIADNLATKIPGYVVVPQDWHLVNKYDYQLNVYIENFDINNFSSCDLTASWNLIKRNGNDKLLAIQRSHYFNNIGHTNYHCAVNCLSGLVSNLSNEIAHEINKKIKG